MRRILCVALLALSCVGVGACGSEDNGDGGANNGANNGAVNNGVNNGAVNNGAVNNGVNNGDANNGAVNNGAVNNGVNNGAVNNGAVNNGVSGFTEAECVAGCQTIGACSTLTEACSAEVLEDFAASCEEGCAEGEVRDTVVPLSAGSCEEIADVFLNDFGFALYCGDDSRAAEVDAALMDQDTRCLEDCQKDVGCNGEDAFPLEECMAYCADNLEFFGAFSGSEALLTCVQAQITLSTCVNALECEGYNEYYQSEADEFPCSAEYFGYEEACAAFLDN